MQEPYPEIRLWSEYSGLLLESAVGPSSFSLFGFESAREKSEFVFSTELSTIWGFQFTGRSRISGRDHEWQVKAGQWFCIADEQLAICLEQDSRAFAIQQPHYQGLNAMGGPVESVGRLRYIDGCTDSLLCAPPLLGEACLNLLHFPIGVDQTRHHHPSFRAGIVASGSGECEADRSRFPLAPGTIFYLPPKTPHKFRTLDQVMNVIAYHPDSDWGPTHEVHPMINRTLSVAASHST